jgi:hypothetical protein
MAVPSVFVAHSIKIKTAGGTDAWIDQIQDSNLDNGIDLIEESGSGDPDRLYVAVRNRNPMLSINTTDLAFLTTCGWAGLEITPGASADGLTAWGKAVPNKGLRDAIGTTSHLKLNCTDGLLVPGSVQAGHNQVGRLDLALHALKGSAVQSGASPFVFTKDQAISSGGGTSGARYTAGVIKLISSGLTKVVAGIMSQSINFGLNVVKESSDAEIDPTYAAIMSRRPVFTFNTTDLELMDDIGEAGLSCTSFAMYFQKIAENGDRVAKATGEHISIISTKGILKPGNGSLSSNNRGDGTFSFTPSKDTNVLAIATNAVIPTT